MKPEDPSPRPIADPAAAMLVRMPDAATVRGSGVRLPRDAVVAIDGPSGSGKSTTARALARRFELLHVDSGAMYRALTLAALRAGMDVADGPGLARLLETARLDLRPGEREATVLWQGEDVSRGIRSPDVDRAVSAVSAHAEVRREMVERQRELGRRGGVVMEGRDIGSVVFPLATAKIYLDASLAARVERRFRQFRERGAPVDRQEVARELAGRDEQDRSRTESPLTVSPDAIVLDTSDWGLAQQVEHVAEACLVNPYLDALLDTDREAGWRECPGHYRLAFTVFHAAAAFFGLRQVGYEGRSVPRGLIMICNHVHWYDPPFVGSTFWRHPVHTLAKEELHRGPLRTFFNWLDTIPIRRKGYDARAFEKAREILRSGGNIFMFPEGTRRPVGRPGPVKNGIGILAQETGAAILPMFIRGTWGLRPGGSTESPLEVRFGPVLRLFALPHLQRHHDRREVSKRIALLCEGAFRELQARSYGERPRTAFETAMEAELARRFAPRIERLFGSHEPPPPEAA
ncbi:MAG: (d)CMP kinase [Candidatus Krumholzibacteriia bacterium]